MKLTQKISLSASLSLLLAALPEAHAQVLPEAKIEAKIALAKKSLTRPMSIAYVPFMSRYYIADGGLTAPPGDPENLTSPCLIHSYSDKGEYIQSARPGLDSRSIYYNEATKQLEVITYNISSEAGFSPNTGIFALNLTEKGDLTGGSQDILGHNPAFGGASTIPTYNHETKQYYAKQARGNSVWVVETDKREKVGEILLDLSKANVKFDDITDYYIAYTGIIGEELAVLDVDHKAILIFNIKGEFVGKSALPSTMKLRSQNHISGLGYANGLFFVFHEPEGEFGTFYGFKVSDLAK